MIDWQLFPFDDVLLRSYPVQKSNKCLFLVRNSEDSLGIFPESLILLVRVYTNRWNVYGKSTIILHKAEELTSNPWRSFRTESHT